MSFQFVLVFACVAAAACGHSIPSSYQKVVIYHPVKHEAKIDSWTEKPKSEWSAWAPKTEWAAYKPQGWEVKAPEPQAWAPQGWEQKAPEHKGWEQKEPEAPANYDFKYEVHDEHTGDIKRQSETASNGAVKGQYSLIDSDGYRRVVEYTADDHHGFQATVKREPTHIKIPQPAPKIEEPKAHGWW